jgi:IS1 family transposase
LGGDDCAALHDEMMRFVQVNRLELDELWSYVGKKQKRITPTDPADIGDQYVFIGIDATRKAIISYRVGKRDGENTNEFLADLRRRIVNRPETSSDGFSPYLEAVERSFRSRSRLCSGNQTVPWGARDRQGAPLLARCSSRDTASSADRLSAPGLHIAC